MNRSKGQGKGKVRKTFPYPLLSEESGNMLNQKRGVERPEKRNRDHPNRRKKEGKWRKKERGPRFSLTPDHVLP